MPARHFISVVLPLPLRPTIPKNSPERMSVDTALSASSVSSERVRSGCSTRSLSVCTCSCGSRNVFETSRTANATPASGGPLTGRERSELAWRSAMQEPPQTASGGLPLGVNLAGYLDSVLGVGQVARQVRGALESAGVAVAPFTVVADSAPRIRGGEPERAGGELHPVNLVCVNPDGLEGAHDSLGAEFFAGRHTIGLWWWEVDAFPDAFRRSFDLVDEVWVGSHHVADALAAVSPVPVVRMPVPVEPE